MLIRIVDDPASANDTEIIAREKKKRMIARFILGIERIKRLENSILILNVIRL